MLYTRAYCTRVSTLRSSFINVLNYTSTCVLFVLPDVLSRLARFQITSNFPHLIYYLRYGRLEPSLISTGVLHPYDIEHVSHINTNHDKVSYLLNEIILKGSNRTLRLFLQCLEDCDYKVHADKIRNTSPTYYNEKMQPARAEGRSVTENRVRALSTPNVAVGMFKLAVETSDQDTPNGGEESSAIF